MVAYTRDVPDAPNNPSVDQPKMKDNTNGIDDILQVDHISFNANNGGTHLQNTYAGFSAGAVLGLPASSTAYPAAGVADATKAQYKFNNSTNTFPLSGLRAYALVDGVAAAVVNLQSFNCTVARTGVNVGDYTVTITAGATATADYGVFVQIFATSTVNSSLITKTNATTFRIRTQGNGSSADFGQFCFLVYQL